MTTMTKIGHALAALSTCALAACGSPEEPSDDAEGAAVSGGILTPGKPAEPPSFAAEFQSWSADHKQAYVWDWLSRSEYCGTKDDPTNGDGPRDYTPCQAALPTGGGFLWTIETFAKVAAFHGLAKTFDRAGFDEMEAGRPKLIHAFGSVAKIELTLDAEVAPSTKDALAGHARPYTGLLAPGQTVVGIARLSLAGLSDSFSPGIAVKIFADGQASSNFQAMFQIDGQGEDQNYFAHSFSNEVPDPVGLQFKALNALFKTVKPDSTLIPVSALGAHTRAGLPVAQPSSPYTISLVPHGDMVHRFTSSTSDDFRTRLRRIEPGTVLYDVLASGGHGEAYAKIGSLKTTSYLIASSHGDAELFFRHTR